MIRGNAEGLSQGVQPFSSSAAFPKFANQCFGKPGCVDPFAADLIMWCDPTPLAVAISGVVASRSDKEVVWAATRWPITFVEYIKRLCGQVSILDQERDPMRKLFVMPAPCSFTVTVRSYVPNPQPAFAQFRKMLRRSSVFIHMLPEGFCAALDRIGLSRHLTIVPRSGIL